MSDSLELTLYFVGQDEEAAKTNLPFDSYESANSYSQDYPGTFIYSASATVFFNTLALADS